MIPTLIVYFKVYGSFKQVTWYISKRASNIISIRSQNIEKRVVSKTCFKL